MEYLVQGSLELTRGALLRIRGGREIVVYVWSGAIWLTQEADEGDRFVGPGGWFRIRSAGVTLVSALGRATITLTSPYAEEFAERIDLVPADSKHARPLYASKGRLSALYARLNRLWAAAFAPRARPTTASL